MASGAVWVSAWRMELRKHELPRLRSPRPTGGTSSPPVQRRSTGSSAASAVSRVHARIVSLGDAPAAADDAAADGAGSRPLTPARST